MAASPFIRLSSSFVIVPPCHSMSCDLNSLYIIIIIIIIAFVPCLPLRHHSVDCSSWRHFIDFPNFHVQRDDTYRLFSTVFGHYDKCLTSAAASFPVKCCFTVQIKHIQVSSNVCVPMAVCECVSLQAERREASARTNKHVHQFPSLVATAYYFLTSLCNSKELLEPTLRVVTYGTFPSWLLLRPGYVCFFAGNLRTVPGTSLVLSLIASE